MDDIKKTKKPKLKQSPKEKIELPDMNTSGQDYRIQKSRRLPKALKIIGIIIAALVVGAAIAAFSIWNWYQDSLQPLSPGTDDRIDLVIESGETSDIIAKNLEDKKIIKNATAFQWYVSQNNFLNNLQAGSYLLSPGQSVQEIVEWLVEGRVNTFEVTLLPGKTLSDIKEVLVKSGFDEASVDEAITKKYDHPLLKDKPEDVNINGYIFPDTYEITTQTTAEELFILAFDNLYKKIQDNGIDTKLQNLGFNLHQGITLASIIELEANTESDRKQVAQVFEDRLKIDMPLGSDVTYLYGAKILGVQPSINLDSPYNTRIVKGFPPGAIANFSFDALEAVVDPAPGDYLYFVAGDDGKLYFAKTEEEHDQNVENYCTTLCERDY